MRTVRSVEGYEDVFLRDIDKLSPDCATSAFYHLEALESEDPEVTEPNDADCELCGAIAVDFEVFCASIPGCRSHRMILTIDRKEDIVFVHGLLKGRKRNCAEAYRIACQQLKLDGKPWEPRHD